MVQDNSQVTIRQMSKVQLAEVGEEQGKEASPSPQAARNSANDCSLQVHLLQIEIQTFHTA
jgi:hypothetical protein